MLRRITQVWRKNTPELRAWWQGGLPAFVTARNPSASLGGVPVFCYHLVEPETFEADLQFLKRNDYRTLSGNELLRYLEGALDVADRSVLLTFDDGARNFYEVAFPLLLKYQARAVAFIAPGLHDEGGAQSGAARPMSWREIVAIAASGLVEFQSHTLESRYIPDWPMPVALAGCAPAIESARRGAPRSLADDLQASRQVLEQHLPGHRVEHLAFPMYVGSNEAIATARTLGFKACYWGLLPGRPLNRREDSPFHICRLGDEFLRRLPGKGRVGVPALLRERLHRARMGREWRRRHGELGVSGAP